MHVFFIAGARSILLCIFTTTNANTFFCLASGPPVCLWKQGEGRDADVGLGLGAAPFPLPLSLERTFDGYESPEKYFASSPTDDDDDGSKGGTRQGGAAANLQTNLRDAASSSFLH